MVAQSVPAGNINHPYGKRHKCLEFVPLSIVYDATGYIMGLPGLIRVKPVATK